jgi:hypothetical protein
LISLFYTLIEERELIGDAHFEAAPGDHPEVAIDFEVGRIASENLVIFDGADALEPLPRDSIDGTDQVVEAEV